jgi:hypothetical protein
VFILITGVLLSSRCAAAFKVWCGSPPLHPAAAKHLDKPAASTQMSIVYREKLEEHQASVHQNATGLLNVIGAAKSLTTGYAGWMAKSLVAATGAGTVFGLAGFMLGLTPLFGYQPCLGFMVRARGFVLLWALTQ